LPECRDAGASRTMTEVDMVSLAVLVVILGSLLFLATVTIDWRAVMKDERTLAVWAFFKLQGQSQEDVASLAGQRALRVAEMRCATCSSQEECARRLAAGATTPVADCPNADLFASVK